MPCKSKKCCDPCNGFTFLPGFPGTNGLNGTNGTNGATGATGNTGTAPGGAGSIIPFSSGPDFSIITPAPTPPPIGAKPSFPLFGAVFEESTVMAFGSSLIIPGGISSGITDSIGVLSGFSFTVPRTGTVDSLFFTVVAGSATGIIIPAGESLTVSFYLLRSTTTSAITGSGGIVFSVIASASTNITSAASSPIGLGFVVSGSSTGIGVVVNPGEQLLLGASLTETPGFLSASAIVGTANAGITIL